MPDGLAQTLVPVRAQTIHPARTEAPTAIMMASFFRSFPFLSRKLLGGSVDMIILPLELANKNVHHHEIEQDKRPNEKPES